LEPQEELLWEGKRVYGVVTCSFAKLANPTLIVCEMEKSFRIEQRDTKHGISY